MEEQDNPSVYTEAAKIKKAFVGKFLKLWEGIWQEAQIIFYKKGQTLFYEKHFPYGAYVLIQGSVRLETESSTPEMELNFMPVMEPFGLDVLSMEWPNPCTAVAAEDTVVLFIPKTLLQQIRNKLTKKGATE